MAGKSSSKAQGPDILSVSASDGTNLIPGLVLVAERKEFKSGKLGWWGQARWTIGDGKYMAQLQVVKINGD